MKGIVNITDVLLKNIKEYLYIEYLIYDTIKKEDIDVYYIGEVVDFRYKTYNYRINNFNKKKYLKLLRKEKIDKILKGKIC